MLGVNPTNPAAAHLPTLIHQALCLRDPDRRLRRVRTTLRNSTRTRTCLARAPNPPNTNSKPDRTRIRSRRRKIRFHRELTYRDGAGGAQSCASALPGALAVSVRVRVREEEEEIWLIWRAAWRRSAAPGCGSVRLSGGGPSWEGRTRARTHTAPTVTPVCV